MKVASKSALYRRLPAVDDLLRGDEISGLVAREGQPAVTQAARAVLARLRQEISGGVLDAARLELALEPRSLADAVAHQLRRSLAWSLRPLINATGVVLHTNLGRAPLSEAAVERIRQAALGYSNLEYDLASGERGKRDVHAQDLFARLLNQDGITGIQTVVVNNCAAAVMLALNTLAEGGEVIVSRGELVEIGGGFRIPEVMTRAGAALREVGTTNRTRIADYQRAIGEKTRLLLRVHRSNFEIVGFTEQAPLEELVKLGRKHKLPVMEDLGGGALLDLRSLGIDEPGVAESLRAGVDLVTYSGDKLLGGPQAGMLSGRPELVARIRSNPMFRALRVDKLSYAALEATLMAYLRQDHDGVPILRMMRLSREQIDTRAQAVAQGLRQARRLRVEIIPGESVVGGGTAPGSTLPTVLLAVSCEALSADELASRLREGEQPIIARVEEGRVLLDLRTVFPEQDEQIAVSLRRIASSQQLPMKKGGLPKVREGRP